MYAIITADTNEVIDYVLVEAEDEREADAEAAAWAAGKGYTDDDTRLVIMTTHNVHVCDVVEVTTDGRATPV